MNRTGEPPTVPGIVAGQRHRGFPVHGHRGARVDQGEVGRLANRDRSPMSGQGRDPGRLHRHDPGDTGPVEQTGADHDVADNRECRLQAEHPGGGVHEGVLLVVAGVRRVVGRDGVDRAVCQGRSEHFDVLART